LVITMEFTTRVNNIPCKCRVLKYEPGSPLRIYGPCISDFDPPESAEFEYELMDRKGYRAKWLDRYNSPAVAERLLEEFQFDMQSELYN